MGNTFDSVSVKVRNEIFRILGKDIEEVNNEAIPKIDSLLYDVIEGWYKRLSKEVKELIASKGE